MKLTVKQKDCPYCHRKKSIANVPGFSMQIDEQTVAHGNLSVLCDCSNKDMTDNEIAVGNDDGYHFAGWNVTINYCPICGRPLNEEEE